MADIINCAQMQSDTWGKTFQASHVERWALCLVPPLRDKILGKVPWKHHPNAQQCQKKQIRAQEWLGKKQNKVNKGVTLWNILNTVGTFGLLTQKGQHKLGKVQKKVEVVWKGLRMSQLDKQKLSLGLFSTKRGQGVMVLNGRSQFRLDTRKEYFTMRVVRHRLPRRRWIHHPWRHSRSG